MIIGLDIGTKRTGVAVSQAGFAQEHSTRIGGENLAEQLAELCDQLKPQTIVIGLPLHSDGSLSTQAEFVQSIGDRLAELTQLPVVYVDEFLTSVEARRLLNEAGIRPEEIEERIDQASARLILQQYLNQDGQSRS